MEKPDPDLGWEILNAFADCLPEELRGDFTANARDYEGMFTSGLIDLGRYREELSGLSRAALASDLAKKRAQS